MPRWAQTRRASSMSRGPQQRPADAAVPGASYRAQGHPDHAVTGLDQEPGRGGAVHPARQGCDYHRSFRVHERSMLRTSALAGGRAPRRARRTGRAGGTARPASGSCTGPPESGVDGRCGRMRPITSSTYQWRNRTRRPASRRRPTSASPRWSRTSMARRRSARRPAGSGGPSARAARGRVDRAGRASRAPPGHAPTVRRVERAHRVAHDQHPLRHP
jgi:hypothetical protein